MKIAKKVSIAVIVAVTLIFAIKLCGGPGEVHPISTISVQQMK